jgi:alcohol dehydrogenase class IV
MSLAALFSGLALANGGLGAAHGLAGSIGGMFPAAHGVICTRLLPHVMETNVHALKARAPHSPALPRYEEAARILTGSNAARVEDGVEWVKNLCENLKVPALSEYGIRKEHFAEITAMAAESSSMKGNPIALTDEELMQIMTHA